MNTSEIKDPIINNVISALKGIADPEVGLNLIDLGIIYDVQRENDTIHIIYTLTNPMCPISQVIADAIKVAAEKIPGVKQCMPQLVFNPRWDPSMISENGRAFLSQTAM